MGQAIDLKLGTHIPLGDPYAETKWWSYLIYGFATRWPNVENRKCVISLLLLVRFLQDFYGSNSWQVHVMYTQHVLWDSDLTYFKVTEVKVGRWLYNTDFT